MSRLKAAPLRGLWVLSAGGSCGARGRFARAMAAGGERAPGLERRPGFPGWCPQGQEEHTSCEIIQNSCHVHARLSDLCM